MADVTPLDKVHAAMASDEEETRLAFYRHLVASELFLLLEEEMEGEMLKPMVFPVDGQSFVLAFDTELRLSQFAGREAAYAALSGRAVIGLLEAEGLGLGINLDVAPSALLLPPDIVNWLNQTLAPGPDEINIRVRELRPPGSVPESLLTSLDARLASAVDMAESAYLANVIYENGVDGHLLGIIDPAPGAQTALAQAISEVLHLSGLDTAALDIAFLRSEDSISVRLAKVGLRFDLPKSPTVGPRTSTAPGMDPTKPPRLQ